MTSQLLRVRALAAAVIVVALGSAHPAAGATFSVHPTQVFLVQRSGTALLTLRNDSTETLRFELSVFVWTQEPSGEMTLEPTEEIVFFPNLLTLKPSEERKVRIGALKPAGAREKTYRIFVKELPPIDGGASTGVRVLTTMGIPIFVRPEREVASASLTDLAASDGTLRFALTNSGTVHFVPEQITVRGIAGGVPVFEHEVAGWYVLAGTRRDFAVPLPADTCARATSLVVHVRFASEDLEQHLETPGGACAR